MIQITIIVGIGILALWLFRKKYATLEEAYKEATHTIRSLRVKFGKTFEHFVPFINNFPGDREKAVFLGMPLDFIVFDEDSIKFVEVKTQRSRLSEKQQRIKQLILDKRVEWHELNYEIK